MDKEYLADKINDIISQTTGDIRKRNLSEQLKYDCGLDSLSIVNLIIEMENAFNIVFNDSDLDPQKLISIEDLMLLAVKALEEFK